MKLGAVIILIYFAYNVALYGAPELKVLGVVGLIGLACLGSLREREQTKDSLK